MFEVYSLIGAVLYAGIRVALGRFLGETFRQGLKYFGAFSWLMFIVVIVMIIVIWQGKRRRDKRVIMRQVALLEAEHNHMPKLRRHRRPVTRPLMHLMTLRPADVDS